MRDVFEFAKFFIKNGARSTRTRIKYYKRMKEVISAYVDSLIDAMQSKVINGVTFYYDDDFELTDEIIDQLESFSILADDDAYTVYLDNGNLVIY